jgi:uncharacterized protein YyaL (SSP411 family)
MAGGGIRDHVGGGFARYSVDATWTVPHFEKTLYDNAQLLRLYAHAGRITGDPMLRGVARDTARYLQRDLLLPEGAFAAGEDADSEGAEGTFYLFTHDEVADAAGPDPDPVLTALGVTREGNFEGRTVLSRRDPAAVARTWGLAPEVLAARLDATLAALATRRGERSRPLRDDKVIAAWNGLAVQGFAEAAIALGDPALLDTARGAARFVLSEMRDGAGVRRSWRRGRHGPAGFCDDHAAMALGCFALYRATGDSEWFHAGAGLTTTLVERFADPAGPGFFATAHDAAPLIARPKNLFDLPAPADNSLAAEALLNMAAYTGEAQWWQRLDTTLRLGTAIAARHPAGAAHHLAVLHTVLGPPLEVAVVGPDSAPLVAVVRDGYRPGVFLAVGDGTGDGGVPLLSGRPGPARGALAYVCRGFVCDPPLGEPASLRAALE